MRRLLTYSSALLLFPLCYSAWSAETGAQNVISSCGEHLGAFTPDHQQFIMPDEQVDLLIEDHFQGLPMDDVENIDQAMNAIGVRLFHIEADIELLDTMLKKQESDQVELATKRLRLQGAHEHLAIILVALKTRRARIFRSIDN